MAVTTVNPSPSERLLIECARPRAITERSRILAGLAVDQHLRWAPAIAGAHWQGLAPRLGRALVVSGVAEGLPSGVHEDLQSAYFATMARSLALRRELEKVLNELRRHGIEVMLLKGAVLAPLVHRDPGVRPMDDLDMLVYRDDFSPAESIVRALGYVPDDPQLGPDHHHAPAMVNADGTVDDRVAPGARFVAQPPRLRCQRLVGTGRSLRCRRGHVLATIRRGLARTRFPPLPPRPGEPVQRSGPRTVVRHRCHPRRVRQHARLGGADTQRGRLRIRRAAGVDAGDCWQGARRLATRECSLRIGTIGLPTAGDGRGHVSARAAEPIMDNARTVDPSDAVGAPALPATPGPMAA